MGCGGTWTVRCAAACVPSLALGRCVLTTQCGWDRYVGETDEVLFEDWFHCTDLGTQLKPIIEAFFASEEYRTQKPTRTFDSPGVDVDRETTVADPVNFKAWCASHAGTNAVLFDGEYRVVVMQAPETWAHYQFHEGEVHNAGAAALHQRPHGTLTSGCAAGVFVAPCR